MRKNYLKDKDLRLWRLLVLVRSIISRARIRELKNYNISFRSSTILHTVAFLGEKATPTTIAYTLLRSVSGVSEALSRLEKQGVIERNPNKKRRGGVIISITENGGEKLNQTMHITSIHKIMSVLSEKEREQLTTLLEKLWYKALEDLNIKSRHYIPLEFGPRTGNK